MADSPPPLDDVEINQEEEEEEKPAKTTAEESDQDEPEVEPEVEPEPPLFAESLQPESSGDKQEEQKQEEKKDVKEEDIEKISFMPPPTLEATAAEESAPEPVSKGEASVPAQPKVMDLFEEDKAPQKEVSCSLSELHPSHIDLWQKCYLKLTHSSPLTW